MRLEDVPPKHRALYGRAMSGKSKAAGIKAHCYMCMGWEDCPKAVAGCTARSCPLYLYRPGARPQVSPQTPTGAGVSGSKIDDRHAGGSSGRG